MSVPTEVDEHLDATRGQGEPLPELLRHQMEAELGHDLSAVRIHDDAGADRAAEAIDARAFTSGSDIYFRAGEYQPQTPEGRHLLAHELAHVVQQSGPAVKRKPDKKDSAKGAKKKDDKGVSDGKTFTHDELGTIDSTAKTVRVAKLELPQFKLPFHDPKKTSVPLTARKKDKPRETNQITEWEKAVADKVKTPVDKLLDRASAKKQAEATGGTYYLVASGGGIDVTIIGDRATVLKALSRPTWDQKGNRAFFDVDHKREYQLKGEDSGNLWLLESSANRSAGSNIAISIELAVEKLHTAAKAASPKITLPSIDKMRAEWEITFETVIGTTNPKGHNVAWEIDDLAKDDVIEPVKVAGDEKMKELRGTEETPIVYSREFGGTRRKKGDTRYNRKDSTFQITDIVEKAGAGDVVGYIKGYAFKTTPGAKKSDKTGLKTIDMLHLPGVEHGGRVNQSMIQSEVKLELDAMSPVVFDRLELDVAAGLSGEGRVPKPTLSFLKNVDIRVLVDPDGIWLATIFDAGSVSMPGPLQITGGALILAGNLRELKAEGQLDFEIKDLATGYLRAKVSSHDGGELELEGKVAFDTNLFSRAEIAVGYTSSKGWYLEGDLEVEEKKIKGVKHGKAHVRLDGEKLSATGEIVPTLKAIEHGTMALEHTPEKGTVITGDLKLGKVTGVKSGNVHVQVTRDPAGTWSFGGEIVAEPSMPGVEGQIHGQFLDGAFAADTDLAYNRGMLHGRVQIGATNQGVTAEGKPDGKATDKITVFGGGSVTIRLAPWLQGTVGLQLKPNGEMVVIGEIGLPDAVDLFPEKAINRNIFKIGIDIPIVGVAVAGQRVGIFATIQGGLDAEAGIGPGQLKALGVKVTYNPEREADTRVEGKASLFVPAHAGLRLFVRGGVGAGIPLVSATAGVEAAAFLGIEGFVGADVGVLWTPSKGLAIDAVGKISAQPKFKFTLSAFVLVELDLWVDTITLYENKWQLAAFDYGSDLAFGVSFPIHYEEGKPFDVSLDQVQFQTPQIDPGDLLAGLMEKLTS